MTMFRYNGRYILPEPPVYDTEKYPYAYICQNISGDGYSFYAIDSIPVCKSLGVSFTQDGNLSLSVYTQGDEDWSTPVESTYVTNGTSNLPLWANFDVPNEDGSIYLKKSTPIKYWSGLDNFKTGLALGLVMRPSPLKVLDNKIPVGGTYYRGVSITDSELDHMDVGDYPNATSILTAGDEFPDTASGGDVYVYGDYEYRYRLHYLHKDDAYSGVSEWSGNNSTEFPEFPDGWGVRVLDETKTKYGAILPSICGLPINTLEATFRSCANMEVAPLIPEGVIVLTYTFTGCTSMCSYTGKAVADGDFSGYKIPEGVLDMYATFQQCEKMVTPPSIPSKVTDTMYAFAYCTGLTSAPYVPKSVTTPKFLCAGCTSLTGTFTIDSEPSSENWEWGMFSQTEKPIVLTGASSRLLSMAVNNIDESNARIHNISLAPGLFESYYYDYGVACQALPALPDWDRVKYPHAIIVRGGGQSTIPNWYYSLYAFQEPYEVTPGTSMFNKIKITIPSGTTYIRSSCNYYRGVSYPFAWSDVEELSSSGSISVAEGTAFNKSGIIWGSYEVKKTDGTTLVLPLEPVKFSE